MNEFFRRLSGQGLSAKSIARCLNAVRMFYRYLVMEKIVVAAVTKLASMFSPVGAIVQAVLTAWNMYCFIRDQIQRIWGVVTAIVDGIGDIAVGAPGGRDGGVLYVLKGPPSGTFNLKDGGIHYAGETDHRYGASIATADVDGDGGGDLFVGEIGRAHV